ATTINGRKRQWRTGRRVGISRFRGPRFGFLKGQENWIVRYGHECRNWIVHRITTMATIKEIEDIHAWRKAREFAQKAYKISNQGTFARDFPLKDQLNRSSGSTMDNIAEGFGRGGNREFANFLSYARGSAEESKSQVYRAYDRKYIT